MTYKAALTYLANGDGGSGVKLLDGLTEADIKARGWYMTSIMLREGLWGRHKDHVWLCPPFEELERGDIRFGVTGPCILAWLNLAEAVPYDDIQAPNSHPVSDWHQPEAQALWARRLVDWLSGARATQLLMAADAAIYRSEYDWFFPEGAQGQMQARGPQGAEEDNAKALMLAQELAQLWQGWAARGWTGEELIWGFLDALSELGAKGQERAADIRQQLRGKPRPHPWEALWFQEPNERLQEPIGVYCHALQISAQALWADRVKARWERERRHSAGVTSPVLSVIRDLTRSGPRTIEPTNNAASIFDGERQIATTDNVPVANIPSLIQTLEQGADALMSPVGISLVIGIIISADEEIRKRALGKASPHLEWDGLEQLAEQFGVAPNKRALGYLTDALDAGARLRIEWPGGVKQGLWTYELNRKGYAGGGSSNLLSIVPALALCPGYYDRLGPSDRLIAPITPLGPLSKGGRAMRPEASLHLELAALLTERSLEIAALGGVQLKPKDITRLASQVGASEKVITSALDRWSQDADSPAVFERVGKCGYLYADNEVYGPARRFLEHQAQMRLNQQRKGQASQRRREGRLTKS